MATPHYPAAFTKCESFEELEEELKDFAYDGLVQLYLDLENPVGYHDPHVVLRGSWTGCPLSYKRGGRGTQRRDRHGRARNAFTANWDNGEISPEELRRYVAAELHRRGLEVPSPQPAIVGTPM